MIIMNFMAGAAMRKVIVKGRTFSLIAPETNFVPLTVNLDKLNEMEGKISKMNLSADAYMDIERLAKFASEKEIAEDIEKDFRKTGWRLVSKK